MSKSIKTSSFAIIFANRNILIVSRRRFYSPRVRSGSARGPFGVRSGSVRAPFGPISDQNFRSQKFKISKIFNLCGRRRRGGGPQAALPSPAARRAPAAAATVAQVENFFNFEFLDPKILVRNRPERSPNGARTDPEQTPNGPRCSEIFSETPLGLTFGSFHSRPTTQQRELDLITKTLLPIPLSRNWEEEHLNRPGPSAIPR